MDWNKIRHGRCQDLLRDIPDGSVDLVATDPPFNIGLKYDVYDDRVGYGEYLAWCRQWLSECHRVLKSTGSIYVCIGDEYAAEMNVMLKEQGFFFRNWIVWYYTFGENQRRKFNRCHTHIHYFTKSSTEWVWNGDDIKVPSARQLKYNDKRAKAGGKLPDDVWELPYTEWEIPDDVWKVSRVCGTFKERILRDDGSAHPCQMPESVMERMIRASSNAGGRVIDPFCGTGTTSSVAHRLGREFWTCDMSEEYCSVAAVRIFGDRTNFS